MTNTPNLQQLRQLRLKYFEKPVEKPVEKPAGKKKMKFKIIRKPVVDNCPICLEKMPHSFMETICKHKFHQSCWNEFELASTNGVKCPMCRHSITPEPLCFKFDSAYYIELLNHIGTITQDVINSGILTPITPRWITNHIERLEIPQDDGNGELVGFQSSYNITISTGSNSNGNFDFVGLIQNYTDTIISDRMNTYLNSEYNMVHIRVNSNTVEGELEPQIYLIRDQHWSLPDFATVDWINLNYYDVNPNYPDIGVYFDTGINFDFRTRTTSTL